MLIHQFALGLFRIIAALTRTLVLAYAAAWLMFLIVLLMGGFILNKDAIHPWWIGAYWTLPMQYLQNGLAVNEFTGGVPPLLDLLDAHNPAVCSQKLSIAEATLEGCSCCSRTACIWQFVSVRVSIAVILCLWPAASLSRASIPVTMPD